MNRSVVRHALYRARSGAPSKKSQYIYDAVEPLLPPNESWETFAVNWDVCVNDGVITIIKPETDYDFIHSTCLEKSLYVKNHAEMELTARRANAIQIVESNMLTGKMTWENYNKTWGVYVDHNLKRVNTKLFLTDINTVTDEMIHNSALSDGAAMTSTPHVPTIDLAPTTPMTANEIATLNQVIRKKKKK